MPISAAAVPAAATVQFELCTSLSNVAASVPTGKKLPGIILISSNFQPSSRPGSVDPYQMMSSSSTSLNSSAYGFMSPTPQQQQQQHHQSQQHLGNPQAGNSSLPKVPSLSLLTGLNFDPSGRPMTSDPNEIAQAVKKMEQCLQMLNSLQRNNSKNNYPHHNLPNNNSQPQQQFQQQFQQQQQQMLQPRAPPSLSAQPYVPKRVNRSFSRNYFSLRSSLRKPAALQPQPEFQEREGLVLIHTQNYRVSTYFFARICSFLNPKKLVKSDGFERNPICRNSTFPSSVKSLKASRMIQQIRAAIQTATKDSATGRIRRRMGQ